MIKSFRLSCLLPAFFCGLILPHSVAAQTEPTIDLNAIRQQQPSFLVRASVDRLSLQYHDGDQLTVTVFSEVDAFVYVLYQQVDGQLFQVYPNRRQPDNRVAGQQEVKIPAGNDLFRWKIGPPYGKEIIKVIATAQPLKSLSDPSLKTKDFNPLPKSILKGVALELGPIQTSTDRTPPEAPVITTPPTNPLSNSPDAPVPNPPDGPVKWAEADVKITTMKAPENVAPQAKRFGVFFGVSEHKFAAASEYAGGRSPNLSTPDTDATMLDKLMNELGHLQETRVFTNADASRKNLEKSICEWLPRVSRPGDTVIIYFSGHGGQTKDDNGDEADGKDEFLVPSDYLSLTCVMGLLKLEKDRKLPAEFRPLLPQIKQLVKVGYERAEDFLIRQTAVTDDLFGHWLQKLDGRQVIVILDICHSGGFATREKSLEIQADNAPFDYLDQELVRLKDIGQSNTALLTASSTTESSLIREEGDLSVMTFYLAASINGRAGSLDLNRAYQDCKEGMDSYFQDVNRKRREAGRPLMQPHHPKLYNPLGQTFFLKP